MKISTFSDALRTILFNAEKNRKDKIPANTPFYFYTSFYVYRGFGLLEEHIQQYRDGIKNANGINLRGFTSTSKNKD